MNTSAVSQTVNSFLLDFTFLFRVCFHLEHMLKYITVMFHFGFISYLIILWTEIYIYLVWFIV